MKGGGGGGGGAAENTSSSVTLYNFQNSGPSPSAGLEVLAGFD